MGLPVVILFWAVAGTLFAAMGAIVLRGVTTLLTRTVTKGRRAVVLAATVFPFVCLGWVAEVFVFQ